MTDVTIGNLGKEIEAKITQWHVKKGDRVTRDQNLADVETEKVAMELPAPDDGVITKIFKAVGDMVIPGDVVATLEISAAPKAELIPVTSGQCFVCGNSTLSTDTRCPRCDSFLKVSPRPEFQDIIKRAYSIEGPCYVVIRIKATTLVGMSGNAPAAIMKKRLKENPQATCRELKLHYLWDYSEASHQGEILSIPADGGSSAVGTVEISEYNLISGTITYGINPATHMFEVSIDGDFGFCLSDSKRKNTDTLAMLASNLALFPTPVYLEKDYKPIKAKVEGTMTELWIGFTDAPWTRRRHESGTAPAVSFEIINVSADAPPNVPASRRLSSIYR